MKNKEFLFLYDATRCNPNGDPDRDNEPRMDKLTKTNLVSETRLKRYIRDFDIERDKPVFVSMVGGQKVSPATRLTAIIEALEKDEKGFEELVSFDQSLRELLQELKAISTFKDLSNFDIFNKRNADKLAPAVKDAGNTKKQFKDEKKVLGAFKSKLNNAVLVALIRKEFVDIRYFGGSFAIEGFSQTITGAIQINEGYSLHPVKLHPRSGATIMGDKDGQSGINKREGVYYSLIGFTGTMNAKRGDFLKLGHEDIQGFREAIIQSLLTQTTDSKKNQFPRLYIEIEYKDKEIYGRLGDLRDYIQVECKVLNENQQPDYEYVRKLTDLGLNFDLMYQAINKIKERIEKVRVWKAIGFDVFDETKIDCPKEILNI